VLGQSKKIAEVVKALVITVVTDSRWRQESGGMTTAKAKRLNISEALIPSGLPCPFPI